MEVAAMIVFAMRWTRGTPSGVVFDNARASIVVLIHKWVDLWPAAGFSSVHSTYMISLLLGIFSWLCGSILIQHDPNASTDSNGDALVKTAAVMLSFSWISVLLRSFVRAALTHGFQADDWIMLAAQANFTVSCVFVLLGVYSGIGRHNKSLDQPREIEALKYQALATASYVLNMWLIKLSIGIFLLRLATQRRYKYILYASIAVVGVWSLVLFFWNLFQCNPFAAQWDYTILRNDPNARCVTADQVVSAAYALSVMTILSDWLYALLPIPMIWQVKMSLQTKMTVAVILGLGVFASIATLVRLKFLSDLTDTADILHAGTHAMVWTLIEPGIAITAASFVTIRPLLRYWKLKGFASTGNSKTTELPGRPGQRSQTNRSMRSSRKPGFASQDVTLVDIEVSSAKCDLNPLPSPSSESTTGIIMADRSRRSTFYGVAEVDEIPDDDEGERRGDEEDATQLKHHDGRNHKRASVQSGIFFIEGNDRNTPSPMLTMPPNARTRGTTTWLDQESGVSSNDGSTEDVMRTRGRDYQNSEFSGEVDTRGAGLRRPPGSAY